MWKKGTHQGYQHAVAVSDTRIRAQTFTNIQNQHSSDFVFSSSDDGDDDPLQGTESNGSHSSFLKSITSIARSSHESKRSNSHGRMGPYGASHSHVERVETSRGTSIERKRSPVRNEVLDDDADWNADVEADMSGTQDDNIELPKPMSVAAPASTKAATPITPTDPDYPFLRQDWQDRMNDPFSMLTRQEAPTEDATRYRKIVKALTKQPFDMVELRKQTWSGIPSSLRALVWQVLIGYLPINGSTRGSVLGRKRKEYIKSITQLFQGTKDQTIWHQITIDVPRTNPTIPLYSFDATHRSLERILYLWAIRHPASGYVQGINDLVTPFFHVFLSSYLADTDIDNFDPKRVPKELMNAVEADTYWCLTKVLDTIQDNYIHEQPGIIRQITELENLVKRDEPALAQHFKEEGLDFIQFAFRWMNCMLMREFDLPLVIRIWDTYLSDFPTGFSTFHVYVCCAFLRRFSDDLLNMEFQDIIMFLQDSVKTKNWTEEDVEMMLSEAYVWQSLYENATAHLK